MFNLGKDFWKSKTFWGTFIFAAGKVLCATGIVHGTDGSSACHILDQVSTGVGGGLTGIGLGSKLVDILNALKAPQPKP